MKTKTKRAAKKPPLDRAVVMRDAHRRYRENQRLNLGFSFSESLATAWAAAKMRRDGTHISWDNRLSSSMKTRDVLHVATR